MVSKVAWNIFVKMNDYDHNSMLEIAHRVFNRIQRNYNNCESCVWVWRSVSRTLTTSVKRRNAWDSCMCVGEIVNFSRILGRKIHVDAIYKLQLRHQRSMLKGQCEGAASTKRLWKSRDFRQNLSFLASLSWFATKGNQSSSTVPLSSLNILPRSCTIVVSVHVRSPCLSEIAQNVTLHVW